MYLGMVMVLIGVALLLGSAAVFVPIPVFVWLIRYQFISREEEFLEGLFGEEYLAYKGTVRRWL
jgi:protein-S-isoprenylcysteine O-methyltransferase Ste14